MKKRFLVFTLVLSIIINVGGMPIVFATEGSNYAATNTDPDIIEANANMVVNSLNEYVNQLDSFNSSQYYGDPYYGAASLKQLEDNIANIQANISGVYSLIYPEEMDVSKESDDMGYRFSENINNVLKNASYVLDSFYNTNTSNLSYEELQAFGNISVNLQQLALTTQTNTTVGALSRYIDDDLYTYNSAKNNTYNPNSTNVVHSLQELNIDIETIHSELLDIYNKVGMDAVQLAGFAEDVNMTLTERTPILTDFYYSDTSNLTYEDLYYFNNINTILNYFLQNSQAWINETLGVADGLASGYLSSSSASGPYIVDYKALARCGNSVTEDGYAETNDGMDRRPYSASEIDYFTEIEELCSTRGLIEIDLGYETGSEISFTQRMSFRCSECRKSMSSNIEYTFEDPLLVYLPEDLDNEVTVSASGYVKCKECGEKRYASDKEVELSEIIDDYYEEINLDGNTYYVKEDFLDELAIESNYRVLFRPSGDTLTLVAFNPTRIDLYYEVQRGYVDGYTTEKFGIYPYYNDVSFTNLGMGQQYSINQGQQINEKVFFVCGFCSKCTTCDNSVASNGATISPMPVDVCVSRYCAEDHACGFFWNYIDNSGLDIVSHEEVDCWDSDRLEASVFCKAHKCENCEKPVIGVNLLDSRADTPSVYQGGDSEFYSDYCAMHFCRANMCAKDRINPDSVTPNKYDSKCTDFPIYCKDHASICGVCGTNSVSISSYEKAGYKAVCSSCLNKPLEADLINCSSCGTQLLKSKAINYNGSYVCYMCANSTRENGYIELNGEAVTFDTLASAAGETNVFKLLKKILPNGSFVMGEYKNFKQFGQSWSSIVYSVGNIGKSGCGPTSVAICATGFGIDVDPGTLVQGWTGEKLYASASANGKLLNSIGLKQTLVGGSTLLQHLASGKPALGRCTRGYYTRGGHYIAITGVREYNGKTQVYVSNPSSYYKTGWTDYNSLRGRGVFEYYAVDEM